jgi:hypothetical protein
MDFKVKGCTDCLLREVLESGSSWCFHPARQTYIYEDMDGELMTPSDCPLLKESIIISIKE